MLHMCFSVPFYHHETLPEANENKGNRAGAKMGMSFKVAVHVRHKEATFQKNDSTCIIVNGLPLCLVQSVCLHKLVSHMTTSLMVDRISISSVFMKLLKQNEYCFYIK